MLLSMHTSYFVYICIGEQNSCSHWENYQSIKMYGMSIEDCAAMKRGRSWRWHDYVCLRKFRYICQFGKRLIYTERKKKTHIHFGFYLYQRCIYCVNESLFEMLNIHMCTHCDTFLCKRPRVYRMLMVKVIGGTNGKIQAVLNNTKVSQK